MRIQRDENIRRAVPSVLVVTPRGPARHGRQRGSDLANELLWGSSTQTTAVQERGSVVYSSSTSSMQAT
jgi:hypothetical protein